jgi:hypothetical protein
MPSHQDHRFDRVLPELDIAPEAAPLRHREDVREADALRELGDAAVMVEGGQELRRGFGDDPAIVGDRQKDAEIDMLPHLLAPQTDASDAQGRKSQTSGHSQTGAKNPNRAIRTAISRLRRSTCRQVGRGFWARSR